jgi:site-specific recombinase XerD
MDNDKSIVTVSSYAQVLRSFASWIERAHPEVVSIGSVNLSHLQRFRRHLRLSSAAEGREIALSTQVKYLSILRSWIRYARQRARLTELNSDDVVLPRRKARREHQPLGRVDVERLLTQPNPAKLWGLRDRAIMATLLTTGLKVSQVCALERRHIREELLGKVDVLPLRTQSRQARVTFDRRTQSYVKDYLSARRDDYSPLFIRHKPGKSVAIEDLDHRLTRQMVNRMLEKYGAAGGISLLISPRVLSRERTSLE